VPRLDSPFLPVILLLGSCLASGQGTPADPVNWFRPNQEVRVGSLPFATAASGDPSGVIGTAIEIVLHDKAVCCGKSSALEDAVQSDPQSLKDVSSKLQGRHRLNDGRSIGVHAEYVPRGSINPGLIVGALLDQHALLIEWKSQLYVVYGAVFDDTRYSSGMRRYAIHKLLLLDPRFSDQRRETQFNRDADDWGQVQGLLQLAIE